MSPWEQHAGRYDVPSSTAPISRLWTARAAKPDHFAQQLADAARRGIVATGPDTILARIGAAIARLRADGLGDVQTVYLTESDMLAFVEATAAAPYAGCAVIRFGSTSKVYGARGGARAVRKQLARA